MNAIVRDNLLIGIGVLILMIGLLTGATALLFLSLGGLLVAAVIIWLGPRNQRRLPLLSALLGLGIAGLAVALMSRWWE